MFARACFTYIKITMISFYQQKLCNNVGHYVWGRIVASTKTGHIINNIIIAMPKDGFFKLYI